jgi:hypothetical protein
MGTSTRTHSTYRIHSTHSFHQHQYDDLQDQKKKKPNDNLEVGSEGRIPLRAPRFVVPPLIPPQSEGAAVTIKKGTHVLTFVESINNIDTGPICGRQVVDAWVLQNEHVQVKCVLQGGNIMSIIDKASGGEHIWLNKEGATNYGANSDAFPLTRGLILHGGIRLAAVTAEHGLYYDVDWDIDYEVSDDGEEASIILSIVDSQEARDLLADPLSKKLYLAHGSNVPMSKYPVTDAKFTFKVTLKKDDKFVRTECIVENTRDSPVVAEAWMPQTYPITADSQIISKQKKRRCKDLWVYTGMLKDNFVCADMQLDPDRHAPQYKGKNGFIVGFPPTPGAWNNANLDKVLDWPSGAGGILYDYPHRDGSYHAVSYGDGRGAAYVTESSAEKPHYTKLWSWGNPALFNREEALKQDPPLAAGRPKAEYYEPWGSAFNTGFFETYDFPPGKSSWEARIVPITGGLEPKKTQLQLRETVDDAVADAEKSLFD